MEKILTRVNALHILFFLLINGMYWFQEIVISNLLQVIRECIQLILIGSNEVSKSVRGSHLNS